MVQAEGDTWIDDHHTCEDIGEFCMLPVLCHIASTMLEARTTGKAPVYWTGSKVAQFMLCDGSKTVVLQPYPWAQHCRKLWATGKGSTDLEISQLLWMRRLFMWCW